MQLSEDAVKGLITTIGYAPQDGKSGIYSKSYPVHDGYSIFIDFNNGKIIYDSDENPQGIVIKVWDKKTSNFSQTENFVVLECVDRLLEKGYAPTCIELEWTYPSGHGRSGRLDILVKTPEGVPFLMVECKTWGGEYEKEKAKMSKNGGQLFTYYSNLRAARYLCLYTSRIDTTVEYRNSIVDVEDSWVGLSEVKDIYSHWNKNFKDNGIFDSFAAPYDIKHRVLTYGELETLKEEDSGKIYNQIMEILRHNAISDKPNAFNKLLNLFVCKIIDEDRNPDEELEFQWLETDTDESLQLRLNDLYKEGMWRFLEIDVIDYKQDDVVQRLASLDSDTKQWVMEMYTNTRLKKSPNFAFVEVQDERTFALNAKVVREIVELLQVYKFRYAQKHEFLGNFFELLLNDSMKQESGQYFTPVPITRFILSSLPLRKLVQDRVNTRENQGEPLPTVIDYACGSGHFLTEYMSHMQAIIDSNTIDIRKASPNVQRQFQAWQGLIKFLWAKDTVYGIDLDNRLVKTTKVSAFFNGDGEANIVWANGLDHFTKSETFRGKLCRASGQDNGQFDILISNPPYSVESFKSTVAFGEESFELYPYLTDNSSEIECLFVERMKQLVKEDGWASIILPSSILTNSGIHARAREILLKYFRVKAIVELGSGTFMKTGTNTIILFLERRSNNDHKVIMREIDRFFATKTDVAVAGVENAFSTYVASVYEGLSFGDYISLLSSTPTEAARAHELYTDYLKVFGESFLEKAIATEKDKMLYFLLTCNQDIVLVKAGRGKQEKKFLGYEFSERRGHEGLHWLPGGTRLYDEADPLNPQKASGYIYRAFLGETIDIDASMAQNVFYTQLSRFIVYGTSAFDKKINLGKEPQPLTKWGTSKVSDLLVKLNGVQRKVMQRDIQREGLVPVVSQDSDSLILGYSDRAEPITDLPLILMGDHTCVFKYIDFPFVCGSDNTRLLKFDETRIIPKFGYYVLCNANIQNRNKYERHFKYVKDLRIPLPPFEVQQRVIGEMECAESEERTVLTQLTQARAEIFTVLEQCHQAASEYAKLGRLAKYSAGKVIVQGLNQDTYVGVDNLLPNVEGKRESDFIPASGTATAYHPGNILLSNIRPYLKKVWLADNHGGASSDVLVLVVDETLAVPEYVFGFVSTDQFFDYEMQNIGSNVKMPRADKNRVLDFQIPLLSLREQQKIADKIAQQKSEITRLNARLSELNMTKDAILKKYL